MSKIICDVCGTSYPDTAAQCPICGCVRPGDAHGVAGDKGVNRTANVSAYNHVKGGHFSKSNVRKRSHTNQSGAKKTVAAKKESTDKTNNSGNKGLVITSLVLILAIIAVVIYIAVRFFLPGLGQEKPPVDTGEDTTTTAPTTTASDILCTDISLDVDQIVFSAEGESRMIYPTPVPANTTETVLFASSDESVVSVSVEGKVTAIAPGTATITVTCGTKSATCTVDCAFSAPTSEATVDPTVDETTEATTAPIDTGFKLNRNDITFAKKGDAWVIYDGNVPLSDITWTSDDETIVTITNGKVEAVGNGTTKVYGEYNGEKASCIIRCVFAEENAGVGGSGGGITEDGGVSGGNVSEDGGNASDTYKLYTGFGDEASDVTIKVGDAFTLQLKNASGEYISVTFSVADSAVCTVSDNTITGVTKGNTTVSATHDGVKYSCIVRVTE